MRKLVTFILLLTLGSSVGLSQDTTNRKLNRVDVGDSLYQTNQDAIYNRPFIGFGKTKTALGGYLEGNTNYFSEDVFQKVSLWNFEDSTCSCIQP